MDIKEEALGQRIIFLRLKMPKNINKRLKKGEQLARLRQTVAEGLAIDIIEKPNDFDLLINGKSFKEIIQDSEKQKRFFDESSDQRFCEDMDLTYLPTDNETLKQARKEIIKNFYR